MRKNLITIILFIASVFPNEHAFGQLGSPVKPYYKFHRLNEVNGLSNNVINDILQDSIGFIWIATNDGLFRYDGADFIVFRNESGDSTSIPHNFVQALHLDEQNNIWALTDYGIGIYNNKTKKITQILPGNKSGNLPYKSTTSICTAGENIKFIGTFGGGVVLARGKNFERLIPKHNPDSINLSEQLVVQVHLDSDSILWIGTWNDGLIQVDLNYGDAKLLPISKDFPIRVYTIYQMDNKTIWLGTNQGLFVFEDAKSAPIHFSAEKNDWLPDNEILSIYEDDKGTIWIGTRNAGLLSLNKKIALNDESIILEKFEPSIYATSISHRTISKVFQDGTGNLWLGTHNSGINIFNPRGEAIKHFTYLPDVPSLSYQSVWGICEANANSIFVGTDGDGVNILNPYSQDISKISTEKFSDKAILCALKSKSGKIWFGTYSGGINIYDPESGDVVLINEQNGLKSNDVRALHESADGTIWICTNGAGLHVYNPKTNSIKHLPRTDYVDIRDIEEDKDGSFWLATFGDGLGNYNPTKDTIVFYNWYTTRDYTPVAFTIYHEKDIVWIGTRQRGLLRFDINKKEFIAYSEAHGLANNTVRCIVPDKLGHLWISTNIGLSCLDVENKLFRNFDNSDGLQLGQFNDGSGIILSNGDLAFGGIHGLNIFSPKVLLASPSPPKIVFTDMIVSNQESLPNSNPSLEYMIFSDETIVLKYDQNTFTLKYNALTFPNSNAWEYDYILSGNETDWNLHQDLRSVTYRNLPPGYYEYRVRSSDKSGIIKGKVHELKIRILPPWWRTWPAYLAYIIIIAFIIFTIIRYNNNQIKLKQGLIYEKKLRQQEGEVMQQQVRFFTNFSHELRSPLTLIQGPVNDLLNHTSLDHQKPMLQLIKRNSNVLLKLVKRLLEFRKIETEKTILYIDWYDLSVLVQEEAESFGYQAIQNGSKLILNSSAEIYAYVDIEKIQIILSNLLSNALKYTDNKGIITLSLSKEENGIIIKVKDTGSGIPLSEQEAIFSPFYQAENSAGKGGTGIGLSLTKSLVEMHEGTIEVDSDDSGSTFTIFLPNDKDLLLKNANVRMIENQEGAEETDEELESIKHAFPDDKRAILIVDDNADILKYVNFQLKNNYNVLTAVDGEKALEIATKTIPDLIISDIMMPKVDGIELCKKLKESKSTNHIPIILLTAKAADNSKVEAFKTGADAYITKPFSSQVLLARVENLLAQRENLKEVFASGNWEKELGIENSPDLKFVKNAESTILAMIDETDVSVPKLARELGFSRTSLYRKIKALTGLSINQFIRVVKLKQASQLLIYEDVTVSEVAFQLGFTDLKYFRNCFKERYDMLPSEYQKQNHSSQINPEDIKTALDL